MLPTYLPQPNALSPHHTLKQFLEVETVPTGWWHNLPKYMISLLKAWYGEHAQHDNEFGYAFIPKLTGDHSQLPMTLAMARWRDEGAVHHRPEPGGRRGELGSCRARPDAGSSGWWCATSR